ncbi:hypothetical protein PO909_014188 [Leuciscus waleckii]
MCHELKSEQEQECPTPPVDFYRHSEQDNGHVDVLRQFLYILNLYEESAELSEHAVSTHSFSFCLVLTPGTLHQRVRFEILSDKISPLRVLLSALSL